MPEFTDEDAESELHRYAGDVNKNNVGDILTKESSVFSKVRGPLEKFGKDIKDLFSMVKDYCTGDYREIPWATIASIVGSLVYVLSPIDLIPDVIPILGLLDDAAVISLCLNSLHDDIKKYAEWKKDQPLVQETEAVDIEETVLYLDNPDARVRQQEMHAAEMDRIEETQRQQIKLLKETLEKTVEQTLQLTNAQSLSNSGSYKQENTEIETIQKIHAKLEKKRSDFRKTTAELEQCIRGTAEVGFAIMISEIEKIKSNTGLFIDLPGVKQKYDSFVQHLDGSIIDVVTRRVSLADAECANILAIHSIDEREQALEKFLEGVLVQGVNNAKDCLDMLMWDTLNMVSFVVTNRIEDKKQEVQRAAEEFASMGKNLSNSEIIAKDKQYKNDLACLEQFLKLA
ncbi:MAG: DUF1232 domain-containing protein [Spirochaetaceae bacterium]|jgi:uncharacterized membrane protein YkvA (DUF1232 family)|nr:DUF1232 domain-containing protein [Spirochaetaceae bacterium]